MIIFRKQGLIFLKSANIQIYSKFIAYEQFRKNLMNLVPKENMVVEILLSRNKEQKIQAKLTKLGQWKVKKVCDEVDDQEQD